jgi:histidine triad (HIT) family protein
MRPSQSTPCPLRPGHTLVVPRLEVDDWLDLDPELLAHLFGVSRILGRALLHGFQPIKVGMMIAGLEVPHVHIHLVPIHSLANLEFAQQDPHPDPEEMDRAAATIRASLAALGVAAESA